MTMRRRLVSYNQLRHSPHPCYRKELAPMLRSLALLLTAAALAACNDESSETTTPDPTYGTCDRVALVGGCIESTGPAPSIANQKTGCEDAGGTWTSEPCPDADQLGCCTYTFGLDFRECWYSNTSVADPETTCATMDESVWTPAP